MSQIPKILMDGKPHSVEEIALAMGKTIGSTLAFIHHHWWLIVPHAGTTSFDYKLRDKVRVMHVRDL